jgi:hypothetical protein
MYKVRMYYYIQFIYFFVAIVQDLLQIIHVTIVAVFLRPYEFYPFVLDELVRVTRQLIMLC